MTVKDPGRIPVGLFQGERLSDDAVRRLSVGASRIVAFADAADASAVQAQWSRVAPEIEVEVAPAVADVREAIIECAKRKVIWLAAPEPRNATRFVAGALQGAAAATEFEIPSVAVHVLRDQSIPGPVAWLTQTGAMSGYGVLYAVAIAAMSGRSVTMIAPTELRAPRTPEAVEVAERYIAESGVEVERLSDPSPLQRVLGGSFGAVVHPVLDAPGGKSLLYPGELPAKSVAQGNPAAVVELLEEFPGDVIAVFDGVQLVYGSGVAARIAAGVALGITAVAGIGAVAAPAALAAEVPPASAPAATGNTAVVQSTVADVLRNLAFPHSGAGTTLQITNTSGHSVTIRVTGSHGHHGSEGDRETVTIQPGETVSVHAPTGGIKQWSEAVVTAIDGQSLPNVITVMTGGTPVTLTPQKIEQLVQQAHVPNLVETGQVPQLPKPDQPTPVRTPPVVTPTGQAPMLVPELPKPDQPVPVGTPPVVTPTGQAPMLVPELPKPDQPIPVGTPTDRPRTSRLRCWCRSCPSRISRYRWGRPPVATRSAGSDAGPGVAQAGSAGTSAGPPRSSHGQGPMLVPELPKPDQPNRSGRRRS